MTLEILKRLRSLGLIELPWPDSNWRVASDGITTPHELLGWRFAWPNQVDSGLDDYLQERLTNEPWAVDLLDDRLRLWVDLSVDEVYSFAERQLGEHGFDTAWANDLDGVRNEVGSFSIARWRYIVWAAVRKGATEFLRTRGSSELTRKAIRNEYRKRAGMFRNGLFSRGEFEPMKPKPFSILAQVFVDHVLPVGREYWLSEPAKWAIQNAKVS